MPKCLKTKDKLLGQTGAILKRFCTHLPEITMTIKTGFSHEARKVVRSELMAKWVE